ncbi:MAG: trigger factor [Microbacterium gubbeenense]
MVNTTVEKLSPTRVKLHITVTPDELKPSIDHAYSHIAKDIEIPGFRKGKVPAPIIDQRVGRGAVIEHAVNDGLDRFFREAVAENELQVLGQPQADITTWPAEKDFSGDLEVDIEVDIAPEFEVPDLENLKVTVDPIEVDDEAIDHELEALRARFGTLVPVERPAAKGDFVELDLIAKVDDAEVDRAEGVSYEIGSGQLLEGTDEALDSLTAGEETTFRTNLVGGEHAEVTITVKVVKERELPEADDDFAQMASEFDTIAELRESLAEQAKEKGAFAQGSAARDKLVEQLLETVELPVPQSLIDDEVHRHLEQENRLEDDEHRAEVAEASEKQFRTQLLFDRIAKDLDVQVSQEEFTQYLMQASGQYGMSPQDFIQALQQGNQLQAVMGDVARNKAIAVVLGKAEVVDTAGDPVNLEGFAAVEGDDAETTEEESADKAE